MSYESIVITKHANLTWFAKDNTMPLDNDGIFLSGWTGGANYGLFTLKSENGGIAYNNQLWSIFSYVDVLDSGNNFIPTSPIDLAIKLRQRGFFDDGSSGGGGVDTFLQLLDVLFPNYAGRGGQVIRVNSGETGLESVTPSFAFQNNIARWYTQSMPGTGDVTPTEVSALINDGAQFVFAVNETATPVIVSAQRTEEGVTRRFIFLFTAGKPPTGNVWGAGGIPTTANQFRLMSILFLSPEDVENQPNSAIYDLGDTTGENFWDVASLQDPPYDLNDSSEEDADGNPRTYYFSFTDDGVLFFAQFIGTPGCYGVGENSFVKADFVVVTDDTITPTPNLAMVTGVGNTTTDPIVINDPVNGNKVSREAKGETYTDSDGNTITIQYPDEAAAGDAQFNWPALAGEHTVAMVGMPGSTGHVKAQAVSGSLQSDALIGVTIDSIDADGGAYPNYLDFLTSFSHNDVTGEVTGIDAFPDSLILFHYTKI